MYNRIFFATCATRSRRGYVSRLWTISLRHGYDSPSRDTRLSCSGFREIRIPALKTISRGDDRCWKRSRLYARVSFLFVLFFFFSPRSYLIERMRHTRDSVTLMNIYHLLSIIKFTCHVRRKEIIKTIYGMRTCTYVVRITCTKTIWRIRQWRYTMYVVYTNAFSSFLFSLLVRNGQLHKNNTFESMNVFFFFFFHTQSVGAHIMYSKSNALFLCVLALSRQKRKKKERKPPSATSLHY